MTQLLVLKTPLSVYQVDSDSVISTLMVFLMSFSLSEFTTNSWTATTPRPVSTSEKLALALPALRKLPTKKEVTTTPALRTMIL